MKKNVENSRASAPERMLSREEFTARTLGRDKGLCVFCKRPATSAHHILERKLWPGRDGYFLSNGASVCDEDHWRCETTEYSVEEVRAACGVFEPALPPGFEKEKTYDKWGNEVLPDGRRIKGPLFDDDGAKKALAKGGHLWRFV